MTRKKGFSLIEVLIVISIISILAATAIPMYLEAQVRARVSATLSEMQTLAFAIETYFIDHNQYIPTAAGFDALTTPISYLSLIPRDPFPTSYNPDIIPPSISKRLLDLQWFDFVSSPDGTNQEYINGAYNHYFQRIPLQGVPFYDFQTATKRDSPAKWVIRSNGPDQEFSFFLRYDASNGTLSPGDICRFGP